MIGSQTFRLRSRFSATFPTACTATQPAEQGEGGGLNHTSTLHSGVTAATAPRDLLVCVRNLSTVVAPALSLAFLPSLM